MKDWQEWIKDKKIVFFAAETVPSAAGSGLNAFRFARYLQNYALSLKIVCFNYNNNLIKSSTIEGVFIRRIPYYNQNLFQKIYSLPFLLFHYIKETIKCDICFIYGAYMPGYESILLTSILFSKKIVFQSTLLGDDDIVSILNRKPVSLRGIKKVLFNRISVYYAINQSFALKWRSMMGNKVNILLRSQGIDADDFLRIDKGNNSSFKNMLSIPEGTYIILSVGILIFRKGYLEAFSVLKELNFPFIYLIAGMDKPDPYHRSSPQEVAEMKEIKIIGQSILEERVRFLGHVADIQKLYAVADMYLHAAKQEGTPGAILEAMICKLPVVLHKIEGIDFIFKNEENCLSYNNTLSMMQCINRIHTDQNLVNRLTENAYRMVRKNEIFASISEEIFKKY